MGNCFSWAHVYAWLNPPATAAANRTCDTNYATMASKTPAEEHPFVDVPLDDD